MIYPDRLPPKSRPIWWLAVYDNQLYELNPEGDVFSPPFLPLAQVPFANEAYTAEIGEYKGSPVFVMICTDDMIFPTAWQLSPLRHCLFRSDDEMFNLAARACQVTGFLLTHKYCGRCGEKVAQDRDELAVNCGHCGLISYPRISPCIIVGIYKDDQILLAQGIRHPDGMHSVLAGFVESGESLEDCVRREVMEEVNIEVTDIEYIESQPWPFPHSLMAGFIARHQSGEIKLDRTELVQGGWFSFDDLPQIPREGTIARRLIERVRQEVLRDKP